MRDGTGRWQMLALLFMVRTAMAFQFQAVGALSPLFADAYGIGLADIGLLVGLYFAPGIVIALPGGSLAARFGDRTIMLTAIALMVAGGVLALVAESFALQIAARVIAGAGGVIVNVIGAKIVADWFAGREIATAMAIYINSWPVGVALALSVLPFIAVAGGLFAALAVNAVFAATGLALTLAFYRAPRRPGGATVAAAWPKGAALAALLAAATIWALFNTALIFLFSFGPALLTERGQSLIVASGTTSLVLWSVALTVPLGGIIADRTGGRDLVLIVGILGFVAGLLMVRAGLPPILAFCLAGLFAGLPGGPIMALPAAILTPATRAYGMGLFYTLYYLLTLIGPSLAGWVAERAGSAVAVFDLGIAMLGACVVLLVVIRRVDKQNAV